MGSGEIDRFPVNQLGNRYNLVRSAVYTRIKALGVRTQTIGNKAYVNSEQLRLLDELHQFIQSGGTTAEFLERIGLQKSSPDSSGLSAGLSTTQPNDIIKLVTAIASEVASKLQPQPPEPDPLAYFERLEQAAKNGWYLSTSEIAYLLDLSPSTVEGMGDRFSEAGFIFTRAGYRTQGEVAWRISKPR
ncbi:MAG: hypothetical protein QNJ46_27330, partial [Leptolyngbyaceae cyanobacterium MO_188.B28]|nr:hypothetical protein [Leptolyngbyaceae cyanobacterium MO_188.B28]